MIIIIEKKHSNINNDVIELKRNLRLACASIKEELDQHLDTINQNTSEVDNAYELLSELDFRMDKLNERMERIEMFLRPDMYTPHYDIELSHREQEVFLLLYTSEDGMTQNEIGRRLGFSFQMVEAYIYNMIAKGIPILKRIRDETLYYVEQRFKDLQAKRNLVKINSAISVELLKEKAI